MEKSPSAIINNINVSVKVELSNQLSVLLKHYPCDYLSKIINFLFLKNYYAHS